MRSGLSISGHSHCEDSHLHQVVACGSNGEQPDDCLQPVEDLVVWVSRGSAINRTDPTCCLPAYMRRDLPRPQILKILNELMGVIVLVAPQCDRSGTSLDFGLGRLCRDMPTSECRTDPRT